MCGEVGYVCGSWKEVESLSVKVAKRLGVQIIHQDSHRTFRKVLSRR